MQSATRIIIVGAGGRLGSALAREYARDYAVIAFNRRQLDLASPEEIRRVLEPLEFNVMINAAALTNVDYCETNRAEAFQLNAEAPRVLAEICAGQRARLIHISTDYVFDGAKREPYLEEDVAAPISVYGESKLEGERLVLATGPRHLVGRVSWVFGPDRPSFIDAVLARARDHEKAEAVADKISTPTYTADTAAMLRPFFSDDLPGGVLHLANSGECSWQEYAQWALDCCHALGLLMKARTVGSLALADMQAFVARRPVYTALGNTKYQRVTGNSVRHWREAVAEYVTDFPPIPRPA